MVSARRLALLTGIAAALLEALLAGRPAVGPGMLVALAVAGCNEAAWFVIARGRDRFLPVLVNGQIALDTLLLALLVRTGGSIDVPLLVFAPAFLTYGAILPIGTVLVHVAISAIELIVFGDGHAAGAWTLARLTVVHVAAANSLAAWLGYRLSRLLGSEEAQSRALASERGELLARNEREAARVRALLDVAQHVSGSHTVDALLRAVCETTAALARAPRVEIFLWDAESGCLRLAAARGLDPMASRGDVRYPGELPVVARLRGGEVVPFGAAPSHLLVPGRVAAPFRCGFAAPMICRESFEGALFVGYDSDSADDLTALVQGIARQAALALVNVRTMEQQQEDAEVSQVLLELSQRLSACLDDEALWTLVTRGAVEVLGLPWAVATRFDERSGSFTVVAAEGVAGVIGSLRPARFRLEDHPVVQEALSSKELVVATRPGTVPFGVPRGVPARAWLGIPLVRGGWVAGFLTVGTAEDGSSFTRRQLRLAQGLGHHAAIALQNARLVTDLEEADRLKSEFVSTMSHELRTPLNVIIGYTEMLREEAVGPVNSGQRDLIDRLDARGRELLELIEATLHVGRLEAGRDTVELGTIELGDLLRALEASTAGLPRLPAVRFEWQIPGDVRQQIVTDRAKVALVVRNLVSNALKFTSEGSVQVRLAIHEGSLVIEVEDSGCGISAEHLPLIFEMFRQVDGSMTRRHGGVGLGLYIVKQFVTRLSGTVTVTSTPGRGSCFRVVLPATAGERLQASAA